jgi:hypothetical protein
MQLLNGYLGFAFMIFCILLLCTEDLGKSAAWALFWPVIVLGMAVTETIKILEKI